MDIYIRCLYLYIISIGREILCSFSTCQYILTQNSTLEKHFTLINCVPHHSHMIRTLFDIPDKTIQSTSNKSVLKYEAYGLYTAVLSHYCAKNRRSSIMVIICGEQSFFTIAWCGSSAVSYITRLNSLLKLFLCSDETFSNKLYWHFWSISAVYLFLFIIISSAEIHQTLVIRVNHGNVHQQFDFKLVLSRNMLFCLKTWMYGKGAISNKNNALVFWQIHSSRLQATVNCQFR